MWQFTQKVSENPHEITLRQSSFQVLPASSASSSTAAITCRTLRQPLARQNPWDFARSSGDSHGTLKSLKTISSGEMMTDFQVVWILQQLVLRCRSGDHWRPLEFCQSSKMVTLRKDPFISYHIYIYIYIYIDICMYTLFNHNDDGKCWTLNKHKINHMN